jgi:NAD(P)H-dependent FMN reductase
MFGRTITKTPYLNNCYFSESDMEKSKIISIVAISGSLKSTSSNTNILKAVGRLVPNNVVITILESLDSFPFFNPDKEEGNSSVIQFRKQLKEADGVIISTPEYAFGVPGVLKNALDFLVSSGELNEKPVAVISASPMYTGGEKALASLLLTLGALGSKMNSESALSIGNIKNKMSKSGEIIDEKTIQALQIVLNGLIHQIEIM